MKRRAVLAACVPVVVAGCTGPSAGSGTTSEPGVGVSRLDVVSVACGSGAESASVLFDEGDGEVSVRGTTTGRNTCYAARLASVGYDAAADELRVVVEAYQRAANGCAECIVEVEYEASVSFVGGLPGSVVVVHRSMGEEREVVATGE